MYILIYIKIMIAKLKLKEIRVEKKLTQIKLAELAGISQGYLSELERNRKSPTLRQVCKIADALNVHPDKFMYYIKD